MQSQSKPFQSYSKVKIPSQARQKKMAEPSQIETGILNLLIQMQNLKRN